MAMCLIFGMAAILPALKATKSPGPFAAVSSARPEPGVFSGAMNLLRPNERDLKVDGRKLHLLDWGGAGRTPLLLLHGFTGHAHAWDTLSIALQPHYHVLALDPRGHGDSDPADVYNPAVAFDDLNGVIDQLGIRSLILIGLSIGGRNAIY